MAAHLVEVQVKLVLLLHLLEQHHVLLLRFLILYLQLPSLHWLVNLHILDILLKLYLPLKQFVEKYLFVKGKENMSGLFIVGYLVGSVVFVFFGEADTPISHSDLLNEVIEVFVELFPQLSEHVFAVWKLVLLFSELSEFVVGFVEFVVEM